MKVGLIGLGRMGEGMSRRMLKAGIEVWGIEETTKKQRKHLRKVMLVEYPLILKTLLK